MRISTVSAARQCTCAGVRRAGMTLAEMLATVAIILLLVGIMFPSLKGARDAGRRVHCLAGMHSLAGAWCSYHTDNGGAMVSSLTNSSAWVDSGADERAIKVGLLYKYTRSIDIYRCGAMPSNRLRSYSINDYTAGGWLGKDEVATNISRVVRPAAQLVFVEEDDQRQAFNLNSWVLSATGDKWVDHVTTWHTDGENFSFADGHAEHWQWQWLYYKPADLATPTNQFFKRTPGNPDLARLQAVVKGW